MADVRKRASSALALAGVLAVLPATADAACAWMLWLDVNDNWRLQGVYTDAKECEAERAKAMRRAGLDPELPAWVSQPTSAEQKLFMRRVCIPDTIDPRGPKGGSR